LCREKQMPLCNFFGYAHLLYFFTHFGWPVSIKISARIRPRNGIGQLRRSLHHAVEVVHEIVFRGTIKEHARRLEAWAFYLAVRS